jgi:hypothetical protein
MRTPQTAVPDRWSLAGHWGLGWLLPTWQGRPVFGHDGATIGQGALLRVVPDRNVVIALLTNGGRSRELWDALMDELLPSTAGLRQPSRPEPPAHAAGPVDLGDWYGRYERYGIRMDLAPDDDGSTSLLITSTQTIAGLAEEKPQRLPLTAVDVDTGLYVTRLSDEAPYTPVVLYKLEDGSRYIHVGARATPMTA